MPRIIVTTDPVSSQLTDETPVLLDERIHSVHLSTSHAAAQLVERLAWAVRDAESAEGAHHADAHPHPHHDRSRQRRRPAARAHAHDSLAA